MAPLQPQKHVLNSAEKMMILRAHQYFLKEKVERRARTQGKVRQRVAECLQISEKTVSRVVAHWNKHHDPSFLAKKSSRGKPQLSYSSALITFLRDILYQKKQRKAQADIKLLQILVIGLILLIQIIIIGYNPAMNMNNPKKWSIEKSQHNIAQETCTSAVKKARFYENKHGDQSEDNIGFPSNIEDVEDDEDECEEECE
jgi:hypothetical protein